MKFTSKKKTKKEIEEKKKKKKTNENYNKNPISILIKNKATLLFNVVASYIIS